jgi:hypothetical protein
LALLVSSGDGGRAEAFPGEAATTVDWEPIRLVAGHRKAPKSPENLMKSPQDGVPVRNR